MPLYQASARSARVAEASLQIDFEASYDVESSRLGNSWIVLECTGGTVYFHGAQLDLAVYFPPGGESLKFAAGAFKVDDPARTPCADAPGRVGPPKVDLGRSGS